MSDTGGASTDPLTRQLADGAFGDLWNYAVRDAVIDRIWSEPDSYARLTALVRSPSAPLGARFAACEVLFERQFTFAAAVGEATVASIYAQALAHNATGMANSWGLLYEHDDAGPVGVRFQALGRAAVPALAMLLDDNREALHYAGSEEATVGNAYHYRVKDFAAFYLGKILRVPVAWHADTKARDREIEALRRSIPAAPVSR